MGDLRRAHDPDRAFPARGHCAGSSALGTGAPAHRSNRMSASGTALAVEGLTLRFGGLAAVDEVSFEVREGEVLSLIGPNGAGKTSAFNAITGYLEPASGEIRYRGARLTGLKPSAIAARGVVRTFQKTSVFAGQTVHDNVAMGLHLRARQRTLAILAGLPCVAREEAQLAREVGD